MSAIILKVDVDTLHGTRVGALHLAQVLQKFQANATFLFSLGPDHTGWAIRRIFKPGFFKKIIRTSVIKHYGLPSLLYGTFLPGPDIGKKCADELRTIANAGFECGIHCWDHTYWQDNVHNRDENWTYKQMQKAYTRFGEIFSKAPTTHGSAGWQMNIFGLKKIDEWGMKYASDGRGKAPCLLKLDKKIEYGAYINNTNTVACETEEFKHIQIPTTLPTMDELLGSNGIDESNIVENLLKITETSERDEVFTLHAELEGQIFAPLFEKLLIGWRSQGRQFISLSDAYHKLKNTKQLSQIPVCVPRWSNISGRSGKLFLTNPA